MFGDQAREVPNSKFETIFGKAYMISECIQQLSAYSISLIESLINDSKCIFQRLQNILYLAIFTRMYLITSLINQS